MLWAHQAVPDLVPEADRTVPVRCCPHTSRHHEPQGDGRQTEAALYGHVQA